jgi:hypothetical protein
MENQDIVQVAQLADASLELFPKGIALKGSELEQAISNWKQVCETTIKSMGTSPELQYLKTTFKLSNEALAVICLVLLPQLKSRYTDLYSRLSNNKVQAPDPDIASCMVAISYPVQSKLLRELDKESPLFYWNYLISTTSLLSSTRPLRGSQLFTDFVSGQPADTLNDLLTLCSVSPLNLSADNNITAINSQLQLISGGFEERQLTLAIKFAVNFYQRPLYRINVSVLMTHTQPTEALKDALGFVTLQKGLVYWQNALRDFAQHAGFVPVINNWLENEKNILFAGELKAVELPPAINPYKTGTIQLRPLNRTEEKEVWQGMGQGLLGSTGIDWEHVNNTYTMNMARMGQTLLRLRQGQSAGKNTSTAQFQECYLAGSPSQLGGLAYLDTSQTSFNDMVLNDTTKNQLDTLQQTFWNRASLNKTVYPGIVSVFRGDAGNGKTMAAESLANALQLPVYRINYTLLKSTTESNLAALFDEAEQNSAALLFDEADALFAVKATTGSLITAFLIQKIESYGGLAILTTNAEQKIDPAFFRRAINVINFPVLNTQQRLQLFQKLFSEKGVQLDEQLNIATVTHSIIMSARSINNIVNAAIIHAVSNNPTEKPIRISLTDFLNAIKQETK